MYKGLKRILVQDGDREGYRIQTFKCSCGSQQDFSEGEKHICPSCHKRMWRKSAKDISKEQTAKILNTKVKWKCLTCKKEYEEPKICCLETYLVRNNFETGWMCSSCGNVYSKQVKCCDAEMIEGQYYPSKAKEMKETIERIL